MMKMTKNRVLAFLPALLLTLMGITLMTGAAHATATTPDMSPSGLYSVFVKGEGDSYTNVLLNQIFGSIFPDATQGTSGNQTFQGTLFSQVIGYFNAAISVLAGFLLFHNLARGVMSSAHEGEVLGHSWSTMWAPLRALVATAMLLPLPMYGGYNTAQAIVAFMTKNATQFASMTWSTVMSEVAAGVVPLAVPSSLLPKEVATEIFLSEMCAASLNDHLAMGKTDGNHDRIIKQPSSMRDAPVRGTDGQIMADTESGQYNSRYKTRYSYNRVNADGNVVSTEVCGYFETPFIPDFIARRVKDNVQLVDQGWFNLDTVLPIESVRIAFEKMHTDLMYNLSNEMGVVANNIHAAYKANNSTSTGQKPDVYPAVFNAVTKANTALSAGNTQIINLVNANGNLNNNLRTSMIDRINTECSASVPCLGEGWIGAGSWYMIVAAINNEMSSLFNVKGTASSSLSVSSTSAGSDSLRDRFNQQKQKNDTLRSAIDDEMKFAQDTFNVAANKMAAAGWPVDTAMVVGLSDSLTGEAQDASSFGVLNSIRQGITNAMFSIQNIAVDQDPMVGIVNFGQVVTGVGVGLVVGDLIIPGSIASTIGGSLTAAGATMSIILPMMPFIFWVMAVTGYFLLIVESFFAVNLWGISMLNMEGEGLFGGRAERGFLMLLAILVTPFLMVAGYLIGMVIFRISTSVLSAGMKVAFAGLLGQSNLIVIALSFLVLTVFMLVAAIAFIERSFSLVAVFPNKVLRWLGSEVELDTSGADRVRGAAAGSAAVVHSGASKISSQFGEYRRRQKGVADGTAKNGGGDATTALIGSQQGSDRTSPS